MFREKMGTVSEWMGRVKLPRDLKAKIRAYYAEVQCNGAHCMHFVTCKSKLPHPPSFGYFNRQSMELGIVLLIGVCLDLSWLFVVA